MDPGTTMNGNGAIHDAVPVTISGTGPSQHLPASMLASTSSTSAGISTPVTNTGANGSGGVGGSVNSVSLYNPYDAD